MPKIYTPKVAYLTSERIDLIAKNAIKDCASDRQLALDAYKYFKDRVDGEEPTPIDKQLMLEALKIVQAAKKDVLRVMEIFSKAMAIAPKGKSNDNSKPSFEDLDEIASNGD